MSLCVTNDTAADSASGALQVKLAFVITDESSSHFERLSETSVIVTSVQLVVLRNIEAFCAR